MANAMAEDAPASTGITLNDFHIQGLVGQGQFGQVMLVVKKDTQALYALKVLRKEHLYRMGNQSIKQAITEKRVLQQMASRPHPFIVSLMFAFQDEEQLYLIMDFVGGGDLFSLLEIKNTLPESWVRIYAAEIVLALEHIHRTGIIFRDLKPENVMVGMDGHLKLTDFGMSKQLGEADGQAVAGTVCGTPEYIAPEVLQGNRCTSAVDWWTLGCLVFEMLTGESPFHMDDLPQMMQFIINGHVELPSTFSSEANTLVIKLLHKDPALRLGAMPPPPARAETPHPGAQSTEVTELPQPPPPPSSPPPPRPPPVETGASSAGDAALVKAEPFFKGLDWERLFRKEMPAPCLPSALKVDEDSASPPENSVQLNTSSWARSADMLQREYTPWTADSEEGRTAGREAAVASESPPTRRRISPAISDPSTPVVPAAVSSPHAQPLRLPEVISPCPPSVTKRNETSVRNRLSLSMELTANGKIWSISPPLLQRLGGARARQHMLVGHNILSGASPLLCREDRAKFATCFFDVLRLCTEIEMQGAFNGASTSASPQVGAAPLASGTASSAFSPSHISPMPARAGAQQKPPVPRIHSSGAPGSKRRGLDLPPAFLKQGEAHTRDNRLGTSSATNSPLSSGIPSLVASGANSPANARAGEQTSPLECSSVPSLRAGSSAGPSAGPSAQIAEPPSCCSSACSSNLGAFRRSRGNSLDRQPLHPRAAQTATASPASQPPVHHIDPVSSVTVCMCTLDGHKLWFNCVLDATISFSNKGKKDEATATLSQARVSVNMTDVTLRETNKLLVRKRYEWSYSYSSRQDDERLRESLRTVFSTELNYSGAGAQGSNSGIDRYLKRRRQLATAFPDIRWQVLEQTCQCDERVVTSWQWTGTHTGPYIITAADGNRTVLPPTSERVSLTGIAMDVVQGGRIVSTDTYYDESRLREQLHNSSRLKQNARQPRRGTAQLTLVTSLSTMRPVEVVLHVKALNLPSGGEQRLLTELQRMHTARVLQTLPTLEGDGICLCEIGAPNADGQPNLLPLLCTNAFVRLMEEPGKIVLQSNLFELLQRLMTKSASEPWAKHAPPVQSCARNVQPTEWEALLKVLTDAISERRATTSVVAASRRDGGPLALMLSIAPVNIEDKSFWIVLLQDLSWPGAAENSPLKRAAAWHSLADLFWHRLPPSWLWFNCRTLESVLMGALNQLELGITLVDLSTDDQQMVWMSDGFTIISGFQQEEVIGMNCRLLQGEPTDPAAIDKIREAIHQGCPLRQHLWNEARSNVGFWCQLSLLPCVERMGAVRYYLGISAKLSGAQLKQVLAMEKQSSSRRSSKSNSPCKPSS